MFSAHSEIKELFWRPFTFLKESRKEQVPLSSGLHQCQATRLDSSRPGGPCWPLWSRKAWGLGQDVWTCTCVLNRGLSELLQWTGGFGPRGPRVMEVSSPALAGRAGLSPHPRGGLSCVALLKRTVSSDKQFHPRLRKLKRKLGQTPSFWQSFLLRDGGRRGQNKTWCDEGQFISSFTTAPDRKLVLPAGGRMRRRRDVSQFWWLWAAAHEQLFVWQQAFYLSTLQHLVYAYPWCPWDYPGVIFSRRQRGGQEQILSTGVPWRDTGMTFLFFSTSAQVNKT